MNDKNEILVIDDNIDMANLVGASLQQAGYDFTVAHSGEMVEEILAQRPSSRPFDLVLLDLLLPDVSGVDVYRRLRQHSLTAVAPIIVLSAIVSVEKRIEMLGMGADDYVSKPFSVHDLLARIAVQIKLHELEKAKQEAEAVAQTQNRFLTAINAVAHQAAQNLDLESMLSEAVKAIREQFPCTAVAVYLYGVGGDSLELTAQAGGPLWDEPIPFIVEKAVEKGATVWQDHESAAPLARSDILLGALALRHDAPRLDAQTIQALEILASQLAPPIINSYLFLNIQQHNRKLTKIASENARLLVIEQRQRQQANWLREVALAVSASLEPDEVLSLSLNYIQKTIEVEQTVIFLLDPSEQHLTIAGWGGDPVAAGIAQKKFSAADGFIGHVMATGASLMTNEVRHHPYYTPEIEELTANKPRSLLCVPLPIGNRMLGVILLINKKALIFSDIDASLLKSVASVIAIALDNAQLYRQQVELLRELNLSQEQLIQSEKLVTAGRLAASLAHEINNPMQAIHSCLQLALNFNLNMEQQTEYIQMANEEAERLMDTVSRVLEFARPAPGKYELANVNNLISQAMGLTGKYIDHGNFSVRQKLGRDLPPVRVVSNQIVQVFLNIMLNAFDAIADSGQLLIQTSADADAILVSFIDSGVGMTEEVKARIFEPFFSAKESGAGLGLTVSYAIVERHGGGIEVRSSPGKGTVVTVRLPAADAG